MLTRLFCCFGSRVRLSSEKASPPPPLPAVRPDSSTTTSSPPNEKSPFKENLLDDKSPLIETRPNSNTPKINTELNNNTTMIEAHSNITTSSMPSPRTKNRTLILDLGDVLFHYAVREITAAPPSTFKAMIKSPAWADLECGLVTEDYAVQRMSTDLSLSLPTIRSALSQCRSLLRVDHELFARLVALKREHGLLNVVAMTNISKGDFARLKVLCPRWDELFDGEFTSFGAGKIKPDLGYYQHVIDSVGLVDPTEAVFVDDKLVNVDAARSFGIHGIVFESPDGVIEQLRGQLMGDGSTLVLEAA
ncbi:hypothetical protein HBI92_123220 [Parastagonospora nodorum]|nr:hypothetical protein HBI92_123220 [Parastagonospora nodorum]